MLAMPHCMQSLITWLTCAPAKGQRPTRHSNQYELMTGIITVLAGMGASCGVLVSQLNWLFLILSWIVTVSGMIKLQVIIVHQCAHGNFSYNQVVDAKLGRWISAFTLNESFDVYRQKHIYHHHSVYGLMRERDPTQLFNQHILKLDPNLSVAGNMYRVYGSLINPAFHLRYMTNRIGHYFSRASFFPQLALLAIAIILILAGHGWYFVICYLIPVTVFFNYSTALRLAVLHVWVEEGEYPDMLAAYNEKSRAIFIGEKLSSRSILGKVIWLLQMFSIHLFHRVFVMVGDNPCHDYHHARPYARDWANYIFARERYQNRTQKGRSKMRREQNLSWSEIWGYHNALRQSLDALSRVKPYGLAKG